MYAVDVGCAVRFAMTIGLQLTYVRSASTLGLL